MHEGGYDTESHGDDKGKAHNAVSSLFYDKISKSSGKSCLFQGDGKDQAPHDKYYLRVHIRRPGRFNITDSNENQKHCNADGRNLKRKVLSQRER